MLAVPAFHARPTGCALYTGADIHRRKQCLCQSWQDHGASGVRPKLRADAAHLDLPGYQRTAIKLCQGTVARGCAGTTANAVARVREHRSLGGQTAFSMRVRLRISSTPTGTI